MKVNWSPNKRMYCTMSKNAIKNAINYTAAQP